MNTCKCCGKSDEPHRLVNCCVCGAAYKITCVDITSSEARKIKQNAGFFWSCINCKGVGADLNGLKATIKLLQEEVAHLRSSINSQSGGESLSLIETEKMVQEVIERGKRANNVIVFGSKEVENSTKQQQKDVDAEFLRDLFSELGVDQHDIEYQRLGKYDPTRVLSRPIKVKLEVTQRCVKEVCRFEGL